MVDRVRAYTVVRTDEERAAATTLNRDTCFAGFAARAPVHTVTIRSIPSDSPGAVLSQCLSENRMRRWSMRRFTRSVHGSVTQVSGLRSQRSADSACSAFGAPRLSQRLGTPPSPSRYRITQRHTVHAHGTNTMTLPSITPITIRRRPTDRDTTRGICTHTMHQREAGKYDGGRLAAAAQREDRGGPSASARQAPTSATP
jgi:hypothetical protein